MDETQLFNLRLPVALHEELRRVAFEERRPMAELVREAVQQYLAKHPKRRS